MEAHGKIYVVALVLAIIFVGISMFLFYLDNKLGKAEKRLERLEEGRDERDKRVKGER
ncbi:MAG: CcmD family protein [Bacteroidetes bacterium]|nr:MAG: CcmD family protein [Bacteroidota bacterium]